MLPVRSSKTTVLLFGFISGLGMDLMMQTGGLFAASTTVMAFVRIFILRFYVSPEDEDNNIQPGLQSLGIRKFLVYTSILVLVSQLTFFSLEVFKTDSFFLILKKALASSALDILLLLFIQMMFNKPVKKKNERRKR